MNAEHLQTSLIMAASLNGLITRGQDQSHTWASPEDQRFFYDQIQQHNLIVMGRRTYDASKPVIKLVPEKRRVVMTSTPKKYESETVPNQLEFTKESPTELVRRMLELGYTEMLIVGGSQVAAWFLRAHLINTIWLTLEPQLFGSGTPLLSEIPDWNQSLQLIEVRQLNHQGTLLLHYEVC